MTGIFLCPGWAMPLPRPRREGGGGSGQGLRAEFGQLLEEKGLLAPEDYYSCFQNNTNLTAAAVLAHTGEETGTFWLGYQRPEGGWRVFRADKARLRALLLERLEQTPGYRGIPIRPALIPQMAASGLLGEVALDG